MAVVDNTETTISGEGNKLIEYHHIGLWKLTVKGNILKQYDGTTKHYRFRWAYLKEVKDAFWPSSLTT
jgi:hypothetical protein